ncbi:hypothetical protein [Arthrobacter woluwensis]|uniref:hypothetical protein n=1 Tax=Arthrobacter woluwensis TaxID=156980 RepID=UPI0009442D03|nr:hypothetical protein [Arthrobacter woluwensis]
MTVSVAVGQGAVDSDSVAADDGSTPAVAVTVTVGSGLGQLAVGAPDDDEVLRPVVLTVPEHPVRSTAAPTRNAAARAAPPVRRNAP